ncbi:hypothetical protein [uncultured Thiodictyon sp.]|uniref:hypothetical protein n=1 Tax=uncultured Thiodictyon sp. TaxID=1846217 RepID=UPI0025D8847E|nr:hypothetical protein [uncultured Thiodictyon sp.]
MTQYDGSNRLVRHRFSSTANRISVPRPSRRWEVLIRIRFAIFSSLNRLSSKRHGASNAKFVRHRAILPATSFEDTIRHAFSLGGDGDTLATITDGVAEALFGIPETIARQGWNSLPDDLRKALTQVCQQANSVT